MITLLGTPRHSQRISRRNLLQLGTLGLGGLALPDLLRLQPLGNALPEVSRSLPKPVIRFWLYGGPSHIDMYDLKPEAPANYRGEFKPIRTNVPGLDICELLPLQSRLADKFALIRNMKFQ